MVLPRARHTRKNHGQLEQVEEDDEERTTGRCSVADRGASGPWGPQFCWALSNGESQRLPAGGAGIKPPSLGGVRGLAGIKPPSLGGVQGLAPDPAEGGPR